MENAITQTEGYIDNALKQYKITDASIAKLNEDYMKLKVDGIKDADGYKIVKTARMDIKSKRVEVEKIRKSLKEESLKFGRSVDGEAKRITALLVPIEAHLTEQEKTVDDEKARIKREVAEKEQKRIQERIQGLFEAGMTFNGTGYVYQDIIISPEQVNTMTDDEFHTKVNDIAEAKRVEASRLAEIERKKKEEEDRLEKQRVEQEAEQKLLEAENERIRKEQEQREADLRAERRKIELEKDQADEKRWRFRLSQLKGVGWNGQEAFNSEDHNDVIISYDNLIALPDEEFTSLMLTHNRAVSDKEEQDRIKVEKAEKEKAEKIKKDAEEQAKKEADEKAEAERVAKMEAELIEKLRPDNEKLLLLADAIDVIKMPELANPQSHDILTKAQGHLQRATQILRTVQL